VFLDAMDRKAKKEDFVIKIPGHGTSDRWRPEDEYMLLREADIMQYLWRNTTIPVPEIIAYSGTLDNNVGFPYIIMSRLPGESADKIWFEQPFDFHTVDKMADSPSLDIEKKRVNFLRSLAGHMTKLQDIPFSAIGMPSSRLRTRMSSVSFQSTRHSFGHIQAMSIKLRSAPFPCQHKRTCAQLWTSYPVCMRSRILRTARRNCWESGRFSTLSFHTWFSNRRPTTRSFYSMMIWTSKIS
jgi:hypothetical protein